MDKYKKLASNTLLFAISTFSSKLLSLMVKPLLSYWFESPAVNGVADILVMCSNLLIPLVSLGISNAVIRFGLEKGVSKQQVYSNGLLCIGMGFGLMVLLYPLLRLLPWGTQYVPLIYVYVLISCLRTLHCQFVRAREMRRLYALDGILCTVVTLAFYVLFLRVLNWGALGYLLAVICADAFSALFLFFVAGIGKYIKLHHINKRLLRAMLRYALPLVPASVFWWVTNASDRFFVAAMMENGEYWTGIYGQSYVLPSLLAVISTVFTEAWQLSAFTDGTQRGREHFFSKVFGAYQGVTMLAGAGVILVCQPVMHIWKEDYFQAWEFIPILTLATIFSSLCNFLNSVYMVEKRSNLSLVTMGAGAAANCILNFALIPSMGVMGAAIATLASYVIVFLLRAYNTRKMICIDFQPLRLSINLAALVLQTLMMQVDFPLWPILCCLVCAFLVLFNFGDLLELMRRLLSRGKRRTG